MEIILLEKVSKLGTTGSIVTVKDGYARNFLLPKKKAIRATKENKEYFETQKIEFEKINFEKLKAAQKDLKSLASLKVTLNRQAGEDGKLYGSVTTKDIADDLAKQSNVAVLKSHIILTDAIKYIGDYIARVELHPEVSAEVEIKVMRSDF